MFFRQNDIDKKEEKLHVLAKIENKSYRECEKELMKISGNNVPPLKEVRRRMSSEMTRLSITLKDSTIEELQRIKNFTNKMLTTEEAIEFMAKITLSYLEKKKFKLSDRHKKRQPTSTVNRVISNSLKREVFLRDKVCTKCGTNKNLNYDHCVPYSLSGKTDLENLRILCFNCNQRARIKAGFKQLSFLPQASEDF